LILGQVYQEIIKDENIKLTPYYCSAGDLTIGAGHNLTANGLTKEQRERLNYHGKSYKDLIISKEQAYYLLECDVNNSIKELKDIFKFFNNYPNEVQHILINMYHQLGHNRFMGFQDFIIAVKAKLWENAANEIRDSKMWRKDSPARAERLANRMESL